MLWKNLDLGYTCRKNRNQLKVPGDKKQIMVQKVPLVSGGKRRNKGQV